MTHVSQSASDQRVWLRVLVVGAALVTVTFGIRQVFGLFVLPISSALGSGVRLSRLPSRYRTSSGASHHLSSAPLRTVSAPGKSPCSAPESIPPACWRAPLSSAHRRLSRAGPDRSRSRQRQHFDCHRRGRPRGPAGPAVSGLRAGDELRFIRPVRASSGHADADERAWMAVGAADPLLPDRGDDGDGAWHAHGAGGRPPMGRTDDGASASRGGGKPRLSSADGRLFRLRATACLHHHTSSGVSRRRGARPAGGKLGAGADRAFQYRQGFRVRLARRSRLETQALATVYLLRGLVICGFVLVPITPVSALVFGAAMGLLWLGTIR